VIAPMQEYEMEIKFEKIARPSVMFYLWNALLAAFVLGGAYIAYILQVHGMYLTGLTNRIPLGIQTVLAEFYIGMTFGCLVTTGLYAVLGKTEYKSFSRVAVYLALLFLAAGLLSMLLDHGRMGHALASLSVRLFVYLALGLICCILLYELFAEKPKPAKAMALVGILGAAALHGGAGRIIGLIPRELYRSLLTPLVFIAVAIASGIAAVILAFVFLFWLAGREPDDSLLPQNGRILASAVIAALCLTAIDNIVRYGQTESREAMYFLLRGGFHSVLFWVGWVVLGCVVPAVLLLRKKTGISGIAVASIFVILGAFCQGWLAILPGLVWPPDLWPGWEIVPESALTQEGIVSYAVGFPEILQAIGIFGFIGILFLWGVRLMKLLPQKSKMPER
jgi:Ni/Fe-hydrogenase subunit HybB-like protein